MGGDLVRASATAVTGGVLIWLLQSSVLASLLLLGVPIWRHVDLLPVVDQADPERLEAAAGEPADGQEDGALAQVLDATQGRMEDRVNTPAG